VEVSRERFESMVADVLDAIPESLGESMDNVAVVVEDWPTPEQLGGRSGTLLGLYQGIALTRRSPLSYAGAVPDRITIFRGPISVFTSWAGRNRLEGLLPVSCIALASVSRANRHHGGHDTQRRGKAEEEAGSMDCRRVYRGGRRRGGWNQPHERVGQCAG